MITIEELRELCALTVELTKLRQAECKHLCIENFAPELLGKLIRERMAVVPPHSTPVNPFVQPVFVQPQWVHSVPSWSLPWQITC